MTPQNETWKELRRWQAADFVAHEPSVARFLVEPIIPGGGVVLLHGKRGSWKTQLALTLAVAVVNEAPFLETYGCSRGRVLYISADMTFSALQDRVRPALAACRDPGALEIIFCPNSIDLLQPSSELLDALGTGPTPELVIFDTLKRIHHLNENDSNTPSAVYAAARDLVGTGATMLFLHHDRKSFGDDSENDPNEAFRGSGAWLDDCDTGLHLVKTGKIMRSLYFSKVRTCEEQEPLSVSMDPDTLLLANRAKTVKDVLRGLVAASGLKSQREMVDQLVEITRCSRQLANRLVKDFTETGGVSGNTPRFRGSA